VTPFLGAAWPFCSAIGAVERQGRPIRQQEKREVSIRRVPLYGDREGGCKTCDGRCKSGVGDFPESDSGFRQCSNLGENQLNTGCNADWGQAVPSETVCLTIGNREEEGASPQFTARIVGRKNASPRADICCAACLVLLRKGWEARRRLEQGDRLKRAELQEVKVGLVHCGCRCK
jgi:hypothetical protein